MNIRLLNLTKDDIYFLTKHFRVTAALLNTLIKRRFKNFLFCKNSQKLIVNNVIADYKIV